MTMTMPSIEQMGLNYYKDLLHHVYACAVRDGLVWDVNNHTVRGPEGSFLETIEDTLEGVWTRDAIRSFHDPRPASQDECIQLFNCIKAVSYTHLTLPTKA